MLFKNSDSYNISVIRNYQRYFEICIYSTVSSRSGSKKFKQYTFNTQTHLMFFGYLSVYHPSQVKRWERANSIWLIQDSKLGVLQLILVFISKQFLFFTQHCENGQFYPSFPEQQTECYWLIQVVNDQFDV